MFIQCCAFYSVKLSTISRPWIKDRFMSPDIEAVHRLLIEQKVEATFPAEKRHSFRRLV